MKYLSIRGQTEYALAAAISDLGEDEQLKTDYPTLVEELLTPIADKWREANKAIIQPPPKPDWDLKESIAAGRELFYGSKANCIKCHGPSELGDGQTTDYDDWSKPLFEYAKEVSQGLKTIPSDPDLSSAEKSARIKQLDELHTALEDTTLTPAHDLAPQLAGGNLSRRRPAARLVPPDSCRHQRRADAGRGPPQSGAPGVLTPDEIWHLVDYIQQLPYEPINQPPQLAPFSGQAQL